MKREAKIGIFAVVMILAAWAGIRFLKGFDIFGRNTVYYAAYDQVNGVQSASSVMMQGVKIGTVTGIRPVNHPCVMKLSAPVRESRGVRP